jgi:hypothetical protein
MKRNVYSGIVCAGAVLGAMAVPHAVGQSLVAPGDAKGGSRPRPHYAVSAAPAAELCRSPHWGDTPWFDWDATVSVNVEPSCIDGNGHESHASFAVAY